MSIDVTSILTVIYKNHDINPSDDTTSVTGSIDQWRQALNAYGCHTTDIINHGQQVYEIRTNKNNMEWCNVLIDNSEAILLEYKWLFDNSKDRKIQFPTYEDFLKYVFIDDGETK